MMGGAWVMIATARPYQWWKLLMIGLCLLAAYGVIFWLPYWLPAWAEVIPLLGNLIPQLQMDPANAAMMTTTASMGLLANVLIEAIWWISGRVTGERRHLFGTLAAD